MIDRNPACLTLKQLKDILDREFGPPFSVKGHVGTRWVRDGRDGDGRALGLNIRIGRRDITINSHGEVTGAGTVLPAPVKEA